MCPRAGKRARNDTIYIPVEEGVVVPTGSESDSEFVIDFNEMEPLLPDDEEEWDFEADETDPMYVQFVVLFLIN